MIDIIIPVYNSKKFLLDTLNSIFEQKCDVDYNIYLIDDCSTEKYDDILESVKDKGNIIYKRLSKNVGPGLARQEGLDISSSDFVVFLDSDDLFADENSLNILYKNIVNTEYDMVYSVIYRELETGFDVRYYDLVGLHGKIFRRRIIDKFAIRFDEKRRFEDSYFIQLIRLCGGKFKYINEFTYIWQNVNKNSITATKDDMEYNFYYYSKASYEAIQFVYDNKLPHDYINCVALDALVRLSEFSFGLEKFYPQMDMTYTDYLYDYFEGKTMTGLYDYLKNDFRATEGVIQKFKELVNFLEYDYLKLEEHVNPVPVEDKEMIKNKHLDIVDAFNKSTLKKKTFLLNDTLGCLGLNLNIVGPVYSNWGLKNVYFKEDVFVNYNFSVVDDGNIYIGRNVIIGPDVKIYTNSHPNDVKKRTHSSIIKDVTIENDVIIYGGAIILPGVTIGKYSVIGAGSVVNKDIPPNVIAAGNPCKVIRVNME